MAPKPKEKQPNIANNVRLEDIFMTGLGKWPWILLSLAVCVSLAVAYLLMTPPVYTRTASIRIKDDSKGKSTSSDLDGFSDLGLFSSNTNVLDEISLLESKNFMEEVVKRLDLDISYTADGKYHTEVLYGATLPVKVTFLDLRDESPASFDLRVGPGNEITLSHFEAEGRTSDRAVKAHFGETLRTPAGKIIVTPSDSYAEGTSYDLHVSKMPLRSAVSAFRSKLKVVLKNDKGNVINLTYADTSTERADDVLNTLIDVYNENWVLDKNQIAVSTSNFINERLGVIESELGNVDNNISSYKSAHLIPDVDQASSLYMAQNKETSDRLVALGTELQMTRYVRAYLANDANRNQTFPSNVGINNPAIENQIDTYNTRLIERNTIAANSSVKNPVVADLDKQLASLRHSILTAIDNHIISLNTQISNLEKSERQTTSRIAANPSQARYLLSVERQQKVKESLYLFLLQKREENELSQAFTAYNTRVIDRPDGSPMPTSPVRRNVLAVAVLLGLLIPFAVIYVKEVNNTKVRGRKDIEDLTVPFLGEIPLDSEKTEHAGDPRVVVREGDRDVMNEAFRVLRTNLGFLTSKEKGSVIMVTSFNPGSGKTFLTVNTGISLAIKGKSVLVIDGDLRRGSASAYVGSPKEGLSDYLVGKIDNIGEVIVADTLQPGLSFLPIGRIPPNPTELLETPRFRHLIDTVRNEYDYVFIDCPPIEIMADAQIVESVSDRTVFVVRAGLLERAMVPELEKLYQEKKYKNMSIILNGTEAGGRRYGYRYGYGYGYGHGYGKGYGYGNNTK